jgi:hypothetical protein
VGAVLVIQEADHVLLRIIPHRNTLNSSNRRLWRVLHELLAVKDPWISRLTRTGRRWVYRLRDDVWWIMTLRAAGDDRRIEFFVALPRALREVFEIKVRNHEQWHSCTIQEAGPEDIGFDPAASELYSLRLARDNMFSLVTDYARQTTPARDLMQTVYELQPGDAAAMFVRLEAVGRMRWRGLADYAWSVWDRGDVPQRPGIDAAKAKTGGLQLLQMIADLVLPFLRDFARAIDRTVFSGRTDPAAALPTRLPHPERQALLVNGNLSPATAGKRNLPVYKTALQVVVTAPTAERRTMLAHSMAGAFGELAGDNRLQPVRINVRYLSDVQLLRPPRWDRAPNLLSCDEVGRVIQLPTADIQDEFADELVANRRVECEIPPAFLDQTGIYAGDAMLRGERIPIHIPTTDKDMTMTSRGLIGSPRVGKDQALVNLIVESWRRHGIGSVILDVIDERNGHRGLADATRDHLPEEAVIDLNIGDFDYPIPFSLAGIVATDNERIVTSRIAQELTAFLMGDDIANHQTREYLREAAKAVRGDLIGIRRMFTDATFRAAKIAELKAAGRDTMLLEDYHAIPSEGRQGMIAAPVLVRLGEIMGDEALRSLFCQRPNPAVDLAGWMREGKVVIIRIPSRDLGEMAIKLLCHWLVLNVFLTKLTLGGAGASTWLVLNEPHQFWSDGLTHFCRRLLLEGPKYRIAPVFALHSFSVLPKDFVDVLMSSSINWHILKNTNDAVYKRLEHYLEPTFSPETAMAATARFQYIASWLAPSGEYQTPFLVNCPQLVGDRYQTLDNSRLTAEHSRMFGRPIEEVEQDIQARSRG